jgi:hypothetical protein
MAASTQYVGLPAELYTDVRDFLVDSNGQDIRTVERFVLDAVNDYLFQEAARSAKAATAHLSEEEIMAMVDEALEEVRSQK